MAQENKRTFNVLIGVTGSVAALKLPLLVDELRKFDNLSLNIEVVATDHSTTFFSEQGVKQNQGVRIYRDAEEWASWTQVSDPVLHIELRRWADILVIAPLDANTMAKLTVGICDNLLTCVVRAWDLAKPLLYCPAMNTHMYNHPITAKQISELGQLGYIEVPAVAKKLACGDVGMGGMADVKTIADKVRSCLLDRE